MSDDIVHEKKTEGQFVLRPGGKKQEDEALLTYVMHTPKLMEMGMCANVAAPREILPPPRCLFAHVRALHSRHLSLPLSLPPSLPFKTIIYAG